MRSHVHWLALVAACAVVVLIAVGCRMQERAPGAQPAVAQKICPVMEGPIDKDIFLDHDGRRVYFCCESCKVAFQNEPEKYLPKLEASARGGTPAPE